MTVTKLFAPCLLALMGLPAFASSVTSASASAGVSSCSQSGSNSAICSASVSVGSQTATASASATATWPSGRLEATADGFGTNTNALAGVMFSNPLIVTGATGSGNLEVIFSGFQTVILNSVGGASVSPLSVTVGSLSTTFTLPNGAPGTFFATEPVSFGTPIPFSAAFQAMASGTFFHDGSFARNDADGILVFPTFVVTDSTGKVIPGASVMFTPEPASWLLAVVGLLWLAMVRRAGKERV